jgi:hypothetical protein
MRHLVLALLAPVLAGSTAVTAPSSAPPRPNPPVQVGATRPVDLVICLDTSGSMEDLLDSARARVWDIVNELGRMTPQPELRVGLVSFGSPGVASAEEGFVLLRTDLTSDLDALYGRLMALGTDGGEEMVGWALQAAVERMSWSPDPAGLRLIFIAGNESADQGVEQVDFRAVAETARRRDIVINALYAGSRETAVTEKWPDVARAGGGNFSAIDASASLAQVATPYDQPLLDLNARLNGTYLPYGPSGEAGLVNQQVQDNNASRLGVQSCSSRVVAKGSALFDNSSWDLVDAVLADGFQWAAIADSDLPEALRPLSQAERQAHVERLRATRQQVQERIQEVSQTRESFLRELRKQQAQGQGLDVAFRGALIQQASAKGFRCGGC